MIQYCSHCGQTMSPGARNLRIFTLENMLTMSSNTIVAMASQLSEAEEQERAFSAKVRWDQKGKKVFWLIFDLPFSTLLISLFCNPFNILGYWNSRTLICFRRKKKDEVYGYGRRKKNLDLFPVICLFLNVKLPLFSQISCTSDLWTTSGMPLTLLVQPLVLPHPSEDPIQVINNYFISSIYIYYYHVSNML